MKATITPNKPKAATKARRSDRRSDRTVPFDEMQRLMRVYGSLKCLRKRKPSANDAKVESVKRKFHRWFPDLEERFFKDSAGFYRPKYGHEFEMRYREEMRARDGESLSRKRNRCRLQRLGGEARAVNASNRPTNISNQSANDSLRAIDNPRSMMRDIRNTPTLNRAAIFPACSPAPPRRFGQRTPTLILDSEMDLTLDNDRSASMSILEDSEPPESTFVAEGNIFDDVERDFFGIEDVPARQRSSLPLVAMVSECPGPQSSLCKAECPELPSLASCSSGSESSDDDFLDDFMDKRMERYCEEILSEDDGCGLGFRFDEM